MLHPVQSENRDTEQKDVAARDTLAARIAALREDLDRVEREYNHEQKIEQKLAFSVEQKIHETQATITGTRKALKHHRRVLARFGEVCAHCLRTIEQRKAAGEAARIIEGVRGAAAMYAQNIIADEYKLGHIAVFSRMGKLISRIRVEMDRREDLAQATQPKRRNLQFANTDYLPTLMHYCDRMLSTFANPSSCRRIGRVSRALTLSILALASRVLPKEGADASHSDHRSPGFLPLLRILLGVRKFLYGRTDLSLNTSDRLYHAVKADKNLSGIFAKHISVARDHVLSRHEMLRWNAAVMRVAGDLTELRQLRDDWTAQSGVTRSAAAKHKKCSISLEKATELYETTYHVPWQPDKKGPVIVGLPSTQQQNIPKKLRESPKYSKRQAEKTRSTTDLHSDFFSIRETGQWRTDIKELREDSRRAFIDTARAISRKEARKPIGSHDGRKFYSIPLGKYGRLVYSIDAGMALLERAFDTQSHGGEDYRKYRNDLRKGNR